MTLLQYHRFLSNKAHRSCPQKHNLECTQSNTDPYICPEPRNKRARLEPEEGTLSVKEVLNFQKMLAVCLRRSKPKYCMIYYIINIIKINTKIGDRTMRCVIVSINIFPSRYQPDLTGTVLFYKVVSMNLYENE